ncbi:regulator of telomere elongation helicase 1 homolog [Toxorhynchites rutilus septentrionalis]|uniref:regulator of telomere elongation helicase 1 homolog n=1 Tax=Toxorhynchites rutilus septentrionalis TaxID=329112 RepID=UPI00247A0312|nr:regulator of telomere elongation helicase 1 homolog [Toxorhynchites rutilus septentrionalis]
MPKNVIKGIAVDFPFEPYQVQEVFMAKIMDCLWNGTNGVLESPPGTGKTLSLLCSTLAWTQSRKALAQANAKKSKTTELKIGQKEKLNRLANRKVLRSLNGNTDAEEEKRSVPRIIYASRTHLQLTQAMRELKKTSYSSMNAVSLGSRQRLCIHPDVSTGEGNSAKTSMCNATIKSQNCSFYSKVENNRSKSAVTDCSLMDIEDMMQFGKSTKTCPFFFSKQLAENADIIFMLHNELLDPRVRKANKFDISNTIIILDEAHIVPKLCEEYASTRFKSSDIALCIGDINSVIENSYPVPRSCTKNFTRHQLTGLKDLLLRLGNVLDNIKVPSEGGRTFSGTYIFDLLEKVNIKESNCHVLTDLLDNIIQYIAVVTRKNSFMRRGGLQNFAEFLATVFAGRGPQYRQSIDKCYKVHIDLEEPEKVRGKVKQTINVNAKELNFWCLNPGFVMRQLLEDNVRSIILTSGTLAPVKPFASELDIPIAVQLENPHIIEDNQVCVKILRQGPDKECLDSSFNNRNNPKYIESLGRTILAFAPVIQGGLLVFFGSNQLLRKCQESWQASDLWAQISQIKPIFLESREKGDTQNSAYRYTRKIQKPNGNGAIFIAVCRGKFSEGIDSTEVTGRALMMIGLPLPPSKDTRVMLKKEYLQGLRTEENGLVTGDEWYSIEATRAVNKAIGCMVSHRYDYGAILLCDVRFHNPRQKAQLSTWVQKHLPTTQSQTFGPIIGEVAKFFRRAEKLEYSWMPPPLSLARAKLVESLEEEKNLQYIKHNFVPVAKSRKRTSDKHVVPESILQIYIQDHLPDRSENVMNTDPMPGTTQGLIAENDSPTRQVPRIRDDLMKVIRSLLSSESYEKFRRAFESYRRTDDFAHVMSAMMEAFGRPDLLYLLRAMRGSMKAEHRTLFDARIKQEYGVVRAPSAAKQLRF